ncbi:MBL fold metallo-hydrolase [Streptomyces sp. WAC 06725]|uniref:MBL fold metallo-hydrolase n=1 Tax=Streptomyces sp. WAC 06725 TaxID=2203209 RepID=UPI001C8BDCCF|nr:MBL fold metallo-hydrolase [Streptomyces sp. WAC 06725]
MTLVHRPEKTAGLPLTRRQLGRLAAAGVVAAAGTGAGLLATAPPAAAGEGDGEPHFAHARRLAGNDPVLRAIAAALTPGAEVPRPPAPAPLKLFDNLALLSVGWVSALAVLTGDGIILIDALTSPAKAAEVIVPGLRALGVRPETIRYVVATHGHGDHIGGAQYLADRYGTRVLMTSADWDLIARTRPEHAPARDLDIVDGQRLVLGGTTVSQPHPGPHRGHRLAGHPRASGPRASHCHAVGRRQPARHARGTAHLPRVAAHLPPPDAPRRRGCGALQPPQRPWPAARGAAPRRPWRAEPLRAGQAADTAVHGRDGVDAARLGRRRVLTAPVDWTAPRSALRIRRVAGPGAWSSPAPS